MDVIPAHLQNDKGPYAYPASILRNVNSPKLSPPKREICTAHHHVGLKRFHRAQIDRWPRSEARTIDCVDNKNLKLSGYMTRSFSTFQRSTLAVQDLRENRASDVRCSTFSAHNVVNPMGSFSQYIPFNRLHKGLQGVSAHCVDLDLNGVY